MATLPSSIPVRSNSQDVTASWWNILRTALIEVFQISGTWTKYTLSYTDLQTAATTNNGTLLTLSAKQGIEKIVIKNSTAFTGGALSQVLLTLGYSADQDKFMSAYSLYQTVASDQFYSEDCGWSGLDLSSGGAVKWYATSTGANLSALTAGSVDIWVKTSYIEV